MVKTSPLDHQLFFMYLEKQSQNFLRHGPVSCKPIFPRTGSGDGVGLMSVNRITIYNKQDRDSQ